MHKITVGWYENEYSWWAFIDESYLHYEISELVEDVHWRSITRSWR
jgi:hypothetical protein